MKTKSLTLTLVILVAVMFGTLFTILQQPWKAGASVEVGNTYRSTTTPTVADLTNLCPPLPFTASSSIGTLGSVNVTVAGTGTLTIYDATTTNNNLRQSAATSSLILVDFPASTAGSYHFDIEFRRGLLVDYSTGGTGAPTTTISFRCGS